LRRLAPDARRAAPDRNVSAPLAQRHLLAGWRTRQGAGASIKSHVDGRTPIAFEPLRANDVSHIVSSDNSGARFASAAARLAGMCVGRRSERRP
jgi:hypothetical protein